MIAISPACKEALIAIEVEGKQNTTSLPSNCKHSENMLFAIDKMLDEIGVEFAQNQEFAVVIGPGSFTGIRIGVALIKGLLAGEEERKVLPLTTFDLMAYSYIKKFAPQEEFACIINGLSGYYFVCRYSADGQKLGEEEMLTSQQLPNLLLIGLEEEGLGQFQVRPTADDLLALAKDKFENGGAKTAQEICPLYLRKSQAEANLDERKRP